MSVFDGLAGVLTSVFGTPVTITRTGLPPVSGSGIFREEEIAEQVADGREQRVVIPVLQLQKTVMILAKGDRVAVDGADYTVLRRIPWRAASADGFAAYELEGPL